ncbi:MAG: cytochrome c family [Geobacteraceae bacterium]|nr:MAG: cytochrome c family [Geobacteraceae bacterium]
MRGDKWRMRLLARLALVGWFGLALLVLAVLARHREQAPVAPVQPIDFPHTVHADRLKLACTFCHTFADRSSRAGVPPLATCMACHRSIAVERPEVRKLRGHVERREPVVWQRVHRLPDHVHFTHKRHVRAGVDCSACHGAVAKMERTKRVRPLTMGWCVTCHRARGAPTDCATCHR